MNLYIVDGFKHQIFEPAYFAQIFKKIPMSLVYDISRSTYLFKVVHFRVFTKEVRCSCLALVAEETGIPVVVVVKGKTLFFLEAFSLAFIQRNVFIDPIIMKEHVPLSSQNHRQEKQTQLLYTDTAYRTAQPSLRFGSHNKSS